MPKFCLNYEYIPVSKKFIERYMPKANAAFVKVYLYALNLAAKGENVEYSSIAQELALLESDVVQAFNYWRDVGVVELSENRVYFSDLAPAPFAPQTAQPAIQEAEAPESDSTRPGYAPGQAARAISENSMLLETFSLAQEILGKPLNPTDTETLYWFYDGLKFSPEVILMLLEYCVSKEKRRMSYIEKVAISWHENGITSMEAVDAFIQKETEHSGYVYSIRKILGITDRALSPSEEQFINRWHDMYKMEEDMISFAYDQCIMQTAKLSFPYMEKILERWYKQGIHTIEHARKDNLEFKGTQENNPPVKNSGSFDVYSDSYDHDSLEALTRKKYNEDI